MKKKFSNILAATDFSEQGNNAINTAVELCKQHQAVLHLIHVVENRYITVKPAMGTELSSILSSIDQQSREQLYNIYESVMRKHNIAIQIHMPTGIPFDEICKAAAEMPIDLVVMGSHGISGIRDFFIGTTAYSVIKNTTKPVLTIPVDFTANRFSNILFPVRPGQPVLEKYQLAEAFISSQNTALHIAVLYPKNGDEDSAQTEEHTHKLISMARKRGVLTTRQVYRSDNFASILLRICEQAPIDLIAINASLDYKWTQFFIGPFTQQVVNHAKVPVLSFREAVNISDEVKKEQNETAGFGLTHPAGL